MTYVAGADFGTLSVRVTIVDTGSGLVIGTGVGEYPLTRSAADPHLAQQSHSDHMNALERAMAAAIEASGIEGQQIAAFAADTTGSSVVVVDDRLQPLDDYYLWCDHRAAAEAAEITERAHAEGIEAIKWCGGVYSHEWGFAKLVHFLRHNPEKRERAATALEHCDMLVATLCGVSDPAEVPRSICAMGHKWMWGDAWGGYPPQAFFDGVDPLLQGWVDRMGGRFGDSTEIAGHLSPEWAARLGLKADIPIPFGAFDSHWDAVGVGCRQGDLVNVVGTSTCMIAEGPLEMQPVRGICGAVPRSVVPGAMGVEAGQSATGDIFSAIARRAGRALVDLIEEIGDPAPGASGLLRLVWDNGDRTVLVRPDLGGITLGWDLGHEPQDELHAAIEGMAMHVRLITERMQDGGLELTRVINGGGIPPKNPLLNKVYADVIGTDVHVPVRPSTGLGACIFAAHAAGIFATIPEAQARLCPELTVFPSDPDRHARYGDLFAMFRDLYFGFGEGRSVPLGQILPRLRQYRMNGA
ncbi:L-ribulokinase [Poseidonocella pacifica]|uniref:L-ribulokinase n=1 Tax=Poseidonocella pacifica TaxID=871651 RepID=A0A1I0Y5H7_9RHOB|nr:ribulokinase [Poseidonocella pacifica]SFB08531.1 L-ribulokinase [Poseidonocella pacifica]